MPISYDAADELLAAGTTTFAYDGNGNQLTKTTGSTTLSYGWDALNRLISVTGGTTNTQYKYDGDGSRVFQQIPAGTYAYVNDPAASLPVVLNENGPDGNIDYLYGLSMISANSTAFQYYHQSDGLGSTSNLTDASGAQKANYGYDPWGKLTLPIDPVSKDKYKFAGQALDSNTGLVFMTSRYYDVSTGRFINRDPLGSRWSMPYSYARNSPMNFVDPSGLSAEPTGMVLGASTSLTTPDTLLQASQLPPPPTQSGPPTLQCAPHDAQCIQLLNLEESARIWSETYGQQDAIFRQAQEQVWQETITDIIMLPLGEVPNILGTPVQIALNNHLTDIGLFISAVQIWRNLSHH